MGWRDYLTGPQEQWPPPATFEEAAAQHAVAGARAQGLPDRITDPPTVARLAALLGGGGRGRR